jgi:hypothetical protein
MLNYLFSYSQLGKREIFVDALMPFPVFRRVRKIAKNDYWKRHKRLSVFLSVCMEQLGCHWTEFD